MNKEQAISEAQNTANQEGVPMVVVRDDLDEFEPGTHHYCPAAARDVLFGYRKSQHTVAIINPN